ncbi:MAG: hypothetical protein EBU70_15325, partial [Actinobacteria bacterium]|nr:hypothetical protein [Actinomycetota bacterium]
MQETVHHREHPAGHSPRASASPEFVAMIVVGVIALAVVGRLVTNRLDRNRIGAYAARNGWQLLDCRWKLFGPGWFGSRRERIYEVRYRDSAGREHAAFAKTSA